MDKNKRTKITIIGAGLAGCFLALVLAKRGYKIDVYERLSENDVISTSSKRSFNLTFYSYGANVLKETGLWNVLEPILVTIEASMTQVSQKPVVNRYDVASIEQYIVQRAKLLEVFINQAKLNPLITFHFSTELVSIDRLNKTIMIQNINSKKISTVSCDVIFGADGVNSEVRAFLQQGQEARHIQEYPSYEYKQIFLRKESVEKMNLKHNIIYTWTRKQAALLAHPNEDKSFSALLILPKDPQIGFASLTSESAIEDFFKQNFSDLVPALSDITSDILENPTGYFVTIYTTPWHYKDFIAIIGDAAHGFLPFYGQGMSAAFVDCMEIAKLIDEHGSDWNTIFPLYQKARKKNTDALADLSKEIFVLYVRHKKADFVAIYYKLETILHKLFPKIFHPPPFVHIASNPADTANHAKRHKRQRKIAKFTGGSLLVRVITELVAIEEKLNKIKNSRT